MSDDAQRWKDKYLSSLEQQEKLERRWELRLDLLRRGLVRSSLAAEGADKAVDQCMQEMREILRRDDMDAALGGLIPRLEKAVLDSEQRRQQRAGEAATALAGLIEQLQRLQPPREVRKALKSLGKQLQDATSHQYLLPALLSQLSKLQGQALTVLQSPVQEQPGLLQRCSVRAPRAATTSRATHRRRMMSLSRLLPRRPRRPQRWRRSVSRLPVPPC